MTYSDIEWQQHFQRHGALRSAAYLRQLSFLCCILYSVVFRQWQLWSAWSQNTVLMLSRRDDSGRRSEHDIWNQYCRWWETNLQSPGALGIRAADDARSIWQAIRRTLGCQSAITSPPVVQRQQVRLAPCACADCACADYSNDVSSRRT